jgi:hypothetical protein
MRLKALRVTIHVGEDVFGPGEVFNIEDVKEGARLVSRGFAEVVEPEPAQKRPRSGRVGGAQSQSQPTLLSGTTASADTRPPTE